MSLIRIDNLSFGYDQSPENIFQKISLQIDSNWKLGFIGRNGRGKTTFLKLLVNEYEYGGSIAAEVIFEYFPFKVPEPFKDVFFRATSRPLQAWSPHMCRKTLLS